MNKTIKKLLLITLAISSTYANAASNKTFLSPRPVGINLAMESVTFNEICKKENNNNDLGIFLETTGFYSKSTNKSALGRYFSPVNKSSFTAQTNKNQKASADGIAIVPPAGVDINAGLILYDNVPVYTTPGSISFSPSQEIYGIKFSYYQNLDTILKGLYLKGNVPLARIKNNMGFSIQNSQTPAMVSDFSAYFSGTQDGTPNSQNGAVQNKLINALIDGENHSKAAIADINLLLGYTFLNKKTYNLALNLGLIIPTGNTTKGRYAFEPVSGNGGHFGLGLGYEFSWQLWGNDNTNIKFNTSLDWRYLFEATEIRTFGIVPGTFPQGFGQYASTTTSQIGSVIATPPTVVTNPAANITTIKAHVTPGNIVDGIAGFTFNKGNFTVDLGYNLFYKEAESIKKSAIVDNANSLFIACYRTLSFSGQAITANSDAVALTNALLDNGTAESACQFSNKVYGGIGYIFKDMEYPINLAVGGHYEFAANNATIENWGLHIKSGISF